ncbi:MAG TPA: TrkA family potassium uptake protein [Phycisphaerae bacterium]|nr:TrkA family potassium uptake protein [Phycisphaerae bacterium]
MRKQVCVIGLGQFGSHLARSLARTKCEVLAIDMNEDAVQRIRDDVQQAIITDVRNPEALESVISKDIDEAIVSLGESMEASILCTLHLKKLGVPHIRAKASSQDHASILKAIGADEIIFPERETAERIAQRILNPDLLDYLPLSPEYRVVEVTVPETLAGKTLAQLHLRKKFHIMVIAIKAPGNGIVEFMPNADSILKPDGTLVIIGRDDDIRQFTEAD